jgi:hypothetical protein
MTVFDSDHATEPAGDAEPGSFAEIRNALGPFMAAGYHLVAVLVAAGRIPAVGSVVDALRRDESGDRSAVPTMPLVSPEKVHC